MLSLTIEGSTIAECEEKVLATADEIRENRELRAQGCTCDLSQSKSTHDFVRGMVIERPAMRCNRSMLVCESRGRHLAALHTAGIIKEGTFDIGDAAQAFVTLGLNSDSSMLGKATS